MSDIQHDFLFEIKKASLINGKVWICKGLPTIIPPVYLVGWHWQTSIKDDFLSLFSLLSIASVNDERDQIEITKIIIKKNFIGGMFLVCGRNIRQTMKIKLIFDDTAD